MPSVGDYKVDAGYGGNVPVRFDINVRYTTHSITASNKHWFLNDIEIPYLSESVLIDKDGITRKINGESYSKTQLTGQVKSYRFIFPYDTRSELCAMLQQDILNGDFEKTYELKYYDGLETVYANIDMKLADLENKASKRDEIVQKLDDAHVSAANANQPLMFTV